ncbi:MAG TPA: TatD family hydrolase [Tepidisphaeraceae bacterium]|jgi:TatD DNase family protein|nr:TatD family hydrolase [Tepidisphaeraceae bacterium]
MIDSHCHLTYEPLAKQLDDVLKRAEAAGVQRMITIGTDLADAQRAIELCRGHKNIRCAIGIHPHHSAKAQDEDVSWLRSLQQSPSVIALGEMGLDYHYDFSPRDRQAQIFTAQLELARELNRPIVIHNREATDDCLAILKEFPTIKADFHCFTGTIDEARKILDQGHILGFTGIVTYKKSDELREVARFTPGDRILVETDSPYLSPEPVRKQKVNEPSFVMHTARFVADLRGISVQELDRITTENVSRHFGWK